MLRFREKIYFAECHCICDTRSLHSSFLVGCIHVMYYNMLAYSCSAYLYFYFSTPTYYMYAFHNNPFVHISWNNRYLTYSIRFVLAKN